MGAVVPLVISAASALYSGYQQNKARQKQDEQMKAQTGMQQEITPYAKSFMSQGSQALGPTLSYYTGMLANPREATAPEQNRINGLYAGQATNVRNQFPRGGYGPAAAENLRGQQRAVTENIIQQGRPMAAGALGNLGTSLAGLGLQGYGMGSGMISNVFQQGLAARNQAMQVGQGVGSGLFNAYQSYLLNRSLQQPGTTTEAGGGGGGGSYVPNGPMSGGGNYLSPHDAPGTSTTPNY